MAFFINGKKAFSLIEIIFVLVLIGIASSFAIPKNNISKLNLAKQQLTMQLKYMRYIAMLDNKYDHNNTLWYRKAWNFKFRWCNGKKEIHYYIFSDINNNGHVSEIESLKDPLTNQYIYSSKYCKDSINRTNYTLISKYYDIKSVDITCNKTSSLGQILFLNDGVGYSKFESNNTNHKNDYKITSDCSIKLIDKNHKDVNITISGKTGYIY